MSNKIIPLILIILLAMLLLLAFGCNNGSNNTKHNFSIYLVKDLSTKDAMSKNINELSLESDPVLTDKEIERYDWEKQTFYLKDSVSLEQKLEGKVPLDGKPFIFLADGQRIYLGSFWNMISSLYYPDIPTINVVTINAGWLTKTDQKIYTIRYGLKEQDPRADMRIYEVLKSLGKLV